MVMMRVMVVLMMMASASLLSWDVLCSLCTCPITHNMTFRIINAWPAQKSNLLQRKIVKLSRLESASNPDWPPGPSLPPSLAASKKIHLFKSSLGTVLQPTPLFKLLSNLHISPFSSCALPAGRFFATTTSPSWPLPAKGWVSDRLKLKFWRMAELVARQLAANHRKSLTTADSSSANRGAAAA